MAASPSRNDWLRYNIALDAFRLSGVSIGFFLQGIIQISGEFKAKHAVLIIEVMDDAGTLSLAFVQQSAYVCELGNDISTHVLRELLQLICYC